jgi:PAS domain S-box-containing protein
MSSTVKLNPSALDALDRFDVGVIRLDAGQVVIALSKAARRLVAPVDMIGQHIGVLFPDPNEWSKMQAEFRARHEGRPGAYETEFTRPSDGVRVPVGILAVAEVDEAGEVVGSIGFIRDLREARVDRAMHLAIETKRSGQDLLATIAAELGRLVPFDAFRVNAISQRREHLRQLYATDADAAFARIYRWWPMPEFGRALMDREHTRLYDLEQFFRQPEWAEIARTDPATRDYLAKGYKHVLSLPVIEGERVVAFVSLDSKSAESPYGPEIVALCERLPLASAVRMALNHEEQDRLRFSLKLIAELGKVSHDIGKVSQALVDRLAEHFGWEHVAVFQRDEDSGGFRVLSQAGKGDGRLPEGFVLGEKEGIIGKAFAQEGPVNVPDVSKVPDYLPGVEGIQSELAVRVPGAVVRWVLNVESKLRDAFAAEEEEAVNPLVREAGFILERAALLHMRTAILRSINDAVIETDRQGIIRDANPGAERLFGRRLSDLKETSFGRVLLDQAVAKAALQTDFACQETTVVMRDGKHVPVLLSGATLPKDLGGRVFVASDLTYHKEIQRIDVLKEVFRQAALETRVPLALAAGWVARLGEMKEPAPEAAEKILKQLRKVDLPLERLMRLSAGGSAPAAAGGRTSLARVVESVLEELPDWERLRVNFRDVSAAAMVTAKEDDLRFCVETMLSFALRTRPEDQKVRMLLAREDNLASLRVEGDWQPDFHGAGEPRVSDRWRRQAISDFVLGEGMLKRLAEQSGGRFIWDVEKTLALELRVPVAALERAPHG